LGKPVNEKRRSRRYELRLPFEVVRLAGQPAQMWLHTLNISSRGVLVADPQEVLRRGQAVEYRIQLPTGRNGVEVYVHCLGAVIRRDTVRKAAAVTLQRYDFVRVAAAAATAGA
jgi:hypothetical protein